MWEQHARILLQGVPLEEGHEGRAMASEATTHPPYDPSPDLNPNAPCKESILPVLSEAVRRADLLPPPRGIQALEGDRIIHRSPQRSIEVSGGSFGAHPLPRTSS